MKRCLLTVVAIFFMLFGNAQDIELFKQYLLNNPDKVEVQDFTEFYKSYDIEFEKTDSIARLLGAALKDAGATKLYLINEMAWIKMLSTRGNALTSTMKLDSIRDEVLELSDDYLLGCLYAREGGVYFSMSAPEHAQKEYLKSLSYFKKAGKLTELKNNLINVGSCYARLGNIDVAKAYYDSALYMEQEGVMANSIYLKCNIARIHLEKGEIQKAVQIYEDACVYYEENQDSYGATVTLMNLADVYHQVGELDKAETTFLKCEEYASTHSFSPLYITGTRGLSEVYYKQGKDSLALEYLLKSDSARIVSQPEQAELEVGQLKMQHEVESYKQQQLLIEAQLESEGKTKILFASLGGFTTLLLIIAVYVNFKTRRKNELLAKQNLELANKSREVNKIREQVKGNKNEVAEAIINDLERAFYTAKVYTDPELTLNSLAKHLGTNRTYLSEAINQHYDLSYSNFVSKVRIEEAREMLTSKEFDHFSIQGIASHVGFKSVSAFNASFKKITGITPSYFRKSAALTPFE